MGASNPRAKTECYQLLRYVMGTQRKHLINMKPTMIPSNMPTPPDNDKSNGRLDFQLNQLFAVLDHDPATEIEFKKRRDQFGSMFAFHGTGADCLYSLGRNGLRNLSNSNYMTAGAVYGQGIYISSNVGLAQSYAKSTTSNFRGVQYNSRSNNQNYGGMAAQNAQMQNNQFYANIRRAE